MTRPGSVACAAAARGPEAEQVWAQHARVEQLQGRFAEAAAMLLDAGPATMGKGAFVSSCPAGGDFAFDVFVSYRQQEPDMSWVRNVLVPALEEKGVRVCIDYRDFSLGLPLLLEMGRAVEQSRFTLAVLTPAYLGSNFTELENTMAEHLGLEHGGRRLLTVLRVASTPRIGLRARIWLDMTNDEHFAVNIDRLVRELYHSAP